MSNTKGIRILLVDSHTLVRRGLRMLLSLQPRLEVVGEAGTVNEALQLTLDMQPDLILLDLIWSDRDGISLISELFSYCPKARILVLSSLQIPSLIHEIIEAGVDGFVPKDITPDELTTAIEQVMQGEFYTSFQISALLSQKSSGETSIASMNPQVSPLALTKREYDVLVLMATCATNREIAQRLTVGEETIRTHVKGVLRKLNQPSRTQAVVEALRLGLLEL